MQKANIVSLVKQAYAFKPNAGLGQLSLNQNQMAYLTNHYQTAATTEQIKALTNAAELVGIYNTCQISKANINGLHLKIQNWWYQSIYHINVKMLGAILGG
jgi:hypothetical protein